MGATHEQATLMLQLYEMRREPRLRQARQWFMEKFSVTSAEEMMQKYPPSSEENTNVRMVVSYWDMCAGIVNRGLVDDEMYFESNGEAWGVWEKMKHIVPPMRAAFKNPRMFAHLEELVKRMEAWREKTAPGSNDAMRQRMAQMSQAAAQAKAAK